MDGQVQFRRVDRRPSPGPRTFRFLRRGRFPGRPRSPWRAWLAMALFGISPGVLLAQDEGANTQTLVRLTKAPKVTASERGQGWTIEVEAKAPLCPPKTKIRFILSWRAQNVETFNLTLPASKQINEKFKVRDAPISLEPLMFRTEIHLDEQSSAVKKYIQNHEKEFHPALNPWTDYHNDHKFLVATQKQIDAELKEIRAFFTERYTNLALLDKEVTDTAEQTGQAEEGFDEAAWRKFLDEKAFPKISTIQKEVKDKFPDRRYMEYRPALRQLLELSSGVAQRIMNGSKDLYRANDKKPVEADTKPKDIDTKTRKRPPITDAYLNTLIQNINKNLGIGEAAETQEKKDGA